MNIKRYIIGTAMVGGLCMMLNAQSFDMALKYWIETSGNISNGTYAPLWFTANRYGLSSVAPNTGFLRTGLSFHKKLNHGWSLNMAADIAATTHQTADIVIQQLYADISWRCLNLGIGSKERAGFPLVKNTHISSGMMVEGTNARPVPQVRGEIKEYVPFPGTNGWLSLKGHVAYGIFSDGNWQESFAFAGEKYMKDVYYHSKSLMFRVGNVKKFPVEFEVGLLEAAQFAGKQYEHNDDGTSTLVTVMPHGLKSFMKAFIPKHYGGLYNVEGNHLGSWNFALNYYVDSWKFRLYLEHYFEDHSQMFWEYGRWKDGQLGVEISFPDNLWIRSFVWEGMSTKDQSGPILYDQVAGTFGCQISAGDNYYNNGNYLAWQHWGMGMGQPFLYGPAYNKDGSISFKSNRVKSQHIGIEGEPSEEWAYRVLLSYVRHWGTYGYPLDKQRKQFSSLYEITYSPKQAKGWHFILGMGLDRGNYLGNSLGGILSIRKIGKIL